jgi:hypothetical protein
MSRAKTNYCKKHAVACPSPGLSNFVTNVGTTGWRYLRNFQNILQQSLLMLHEGYPCFDS